MRTERLRQVTTGDRSSRRNTTPQQRLVPVRRLPFAISSGSRASTLHSARSAQRRNTRQRLNPPTTGESAPGLPAETQQPTSCRTRVGLCTPLPATVGHPPTSKSPAEGELTLSKSSAGLAGRLVLPAASRRFMGPRPYPTVRGVDCTTAGAEIGDRPAKRRDPSSAEPDSFCRKQFVYFPSASWHPRVYTKTHLSGDSRAGDATPQVTSILLQQAVHWDQQRFVKTACWHSSAGSASTQKQYVFKQHPLNWDRGQSHIEAPRTTPYFNAQDHYLLKAITLKW
ncbi:hypothetical protein NDU88_002369 [Pleurodeles waltl]|uniref:Uncharacterized protein n=1 Tax=Pleurodeles waltl TaxID=8319 RepID=A0AAV7T1X3_PLEWA|nr:hypothetical protein NDU88_002369 [Pleurodeles waltl]